MQKIKELQRGLFILGIILFFVFGSQLLVNAFSKEDIHWNSMDHLYSLEEADRYTVIYVDGEPLGKQLTDETIYIECDGSIYEPLSIERVGVRINHWYEKQALKLWLTTFQSTFFGIGITCLIISLYLSFIVKNMAISDSLEIKIEPPEPEDESEPPA